MWELDCEEGWATNNWCFWTVVLEKTLESPLDCKIRPVHPKGNQSWIFIGRIDAEAETPVLWPPMWRTDSLEKTLMLGKIEGRRRRGWQRMRWLVASPTQWTQVWVGSRSWWWTGKPGMPQNWTELLLKVCSCKQQTPLPSVWFWICIYWNTSHKVWSYRKRNCNIIVGGKSLFIAKTSLITDAETGCQKYHPGQPQGEQLRCRRGWRWRCHEDVG